MSPPTAFAESTHISSSALKPDYVVPSNKHLAGIFRGKNHFDEEKVLKLLLNCDIPNDGQAVNDYTLPAAGSSSSCLVSITLGLQAPSQELSHTDRRRLNESGELFNKLFGKEIILDISGMTVLRYGMGEKGMKADLIGSGERVVLLPDGTTNTLFKVNSSNSSNTPPWFSSPTPTPGRAEASKQAQSRTTPPTGESSSRMRPFTSHLTNLNFSKPIPDLGKKRSSSPDKSTESKRPRPNEEQVGFPKRNGFDILHRQPRRLGSDTSEAAVAPPKSPETLRRETEERVKEKGRLISATRARAQATTETFNIETDDLMLDDLTEQDIFTPMTPESDGERRLLPDVEGPAFKVKSIPAPSRTAPVLSAASDKRDNTNPARPGSSKSSPAIATTHPSTERHDIDELAGFQVHRTPTHFQSPHTYESREARSKRLGTHDHSSPVKPHIEQSPSAELMASEDRGPSAAGQAAQYTRSPADGSRHTPESMDEDTSPLREVKPGPVGPSPVMTAIEKAQAKSMAEVEARRARRREEDEHASSLQSSTVLNRIEYIPISMARNGHRGSIMGIVVENPRAPHKARDWTTHLVIVDPSTHVNGAEGEGMVIQIFRANEADLPMNLYPGRAILFRNLKFGFYKEKVKGHIWSTGPMELNGWAYSDKAGKMTTSAGITVSEEEIERLKQLRAWWAKSHAGGQGQNVDGPGASSYSPSKAKRGAILLKDVEIGNFITATVKILHVVRNISANPRYEVYVTDGTAHRNPTHNFHNVQIGIPPSAVFCMAIFDQQPPDMDKVLNDGNYAKFPNVRVLSNSNNGLTQLRWSEIVTAEQRKMGWQSKRCEAISPNDHRATEINRRINELKRIEEGLGPKPAAPVQQNAEAGPSTHNAPIADIAHHAVPISAPAPAQDIPLATYLSTTYTDEIVYPLSTIAQITENTMVPNKFRLQARVKAIFPRYPLTGASPFPNYICFYCKECNRPYIDNLKICHGCKDAVLAQAELRYRFVVILEEGGNTLTTLIADDHAAEFLPPLPPISATNNPNDIKKIETRVKEANEGVEKMLLGAMMDGQRSRPAIDWTLECYAIKNTKNTKKGAKGEVVVYSVFGMKSS